MITYNEIKLSLDEALNNQVEKRNIILKIVKRFRIYESDIIEVKIDKKALDARNKDNIIFVYNVDITLKNETLYLKKNPKLIQTSRPLYQEITRGSKTIEHRIVVVGFGPAGIFASFYLQKRGYQVLVLEQGEDVISRTISIETFLKTGIFDSKASVLFGEGGAGTFSDGKLTTQVNDIRSKMILDILVEGGAPEEIKYLSKPHIGTDVLKKVVSNIRKQIITMGGIIRFNAKVTDFIFDAGQLIQLEINHQEIIPVDVCLLGIGHSAIDTIKQLYEKKMDISQKPFSIGVRIEHSQEMINQAQYGKFYSHPSLGAADYKLVYHHPNGRTAYTFCMCPGGTVMPSNGEECRIVTNGMSLSTRNSKNANSAFLVNVNPSDFENDHPLAGFAFQELYERLAFIKGGSNYFAPIQTVGDFLQKKPSVSIGTIQPSYKPGTNFVQMDEILPPFVVNTLRDALPNLDKQLKGFSSADALLTGVETRSSSPIRMNRDSSHESSLKGIYPMGEGAGFAGGIMSSAIDGIKTAEQVVMKYKEN